MINVCYLQNKVDFYHIKRRDNDYGSKNGIIIDGVLHELKLGKCSECSLYDICNDECSICASLNTPPFGIFVNRGKVTDIKIDKEE